MEEDATEMLSMTSTASADDVTGGTAHQSVGGEEIEETTSLTSNDNGLNVEDTEDRDHDSQPVLPESEEQMPLIAEEPESTGDVNPSHHDAIRHHDDSDNDLTSGEELEVETKSKKRKESFVLRIIPGRRNSASLQFVKLPRSRLPRRRQQQSSEHLEEEEIGSSDEVELLQEEGESEERQDAKSRLKGRLVQFKQSIIESLKTLKYFIK